MCLAEGLRGVVDIPLSCGVYPTDLMIDNPVQFLSSLDGQNWRSQTFNLALREPLHVTREAHYSFDC